MTNTAIQDVQKQDPGSAVVELWELVLSDSSSAYFHSGVEADLSTIQFRDRSSPGTIRACIPFRDFITSGYIIPLWADTFFEYENSR